ncbi:MAG: glycosyltransferase [Candidatus Omnitrophica bacterium]|nr:glycosyltransferase [Candidatus Omnitrophota bacterium]
MNAPKLSVLMSAYNSERYLDESIRSILDQSFKDFEFLIIDDGSTDRSFEILNSYQKIDNRIRVIKNKENVGLSKSLNIGIKEAQGEYIARQDADDISMPDRLGKQIAFMQDNEEIAVSGAFYRMVDEKGRLLYRFRMPVEDSEIKKWLKEVNCFCHGSVMFRKKNIKEACLYPEQYECSQDYALWLTISRNYKLANIPEFLYTLRLHENARSVKDKAKQWDCLFRIKKGKGIIADTRSLSDRFIADEFFRYSNFFNKMGMKKLALGHFIKGVLYRTFVSPMSVRGDKTLGICMLTGVFYPEISGGGLQCRTLVNALKYDSNLRFFVLTTTKDPLLQDKNSDLYIKRIYVGDMSITAKFIAALQFVRVFLGIRNKVGIIHLHGFSSKTLLMILLAKIFRKKIIQKITSLGDDDPTSIGNRRFGKLKRFFFSKADFYISVNPAMSQRLLDSGISQDKMLTIPNGVDTERFCPPKSLDEKYTLRESLKLHKEAFIILFVGFFSKDKGVDVLFEAYKNIATDFKDKDLRLLFIGSTDTSYFEIKKEIIERIKKEIEINKMEEKVLFIEKALDIERYYKAADIFVLPSFREGLPNSLMEAMASGLPCVSSRLRVIEDYLITHDSDGLLFEPGDINGLYSTLIRLLEKPDLAKEMGIKARKRIIDYFSIEQLAKKYRDVYLSLVQK